MVPYIDQPLSYAESTTQALQPPSSARPKKSPGRPLPSTERPKKSPRVLRTAGLFAGIGGIELGLSRAGHQTSLLCEIDAGARAVLERQFRDVPVEHDVCALLDVGPEISLVTAGFPCQDLSQAGLTAGIGGQRSGLIHQVFRLLERRRVSWLLLENVPFMLRLARGRALEVIVSRLEELGYHWAYRVVDALAFGLPQRRQRVYLVASLDGDPREVLFADDAKPRQDDEVYPDVACGFYWTEGTRGLGWAVDAIPTLKGGSAIGVPSPPAVLLPNGNIVTPSITDAERLQGFPMDWTKSARAISGQNARWTLVGNAVNVLVAEWVGKRLAVPAEPILKESRRLQVGDPWPIAAFNVGAGRFSNTLSQWPATGERQRLHEFLGPNRDLLSLRATTGFLSRAEKASLRFPDGFLDAVRAHRKRMVQLA